MRTIFLVLCLLSSQAQADSLDENRLSVAQRLQNGENRGLAVEAMTNMVNLASDALAARGYTTDALELQSDWDDHYASVVAGLKRDVGDHEPLSWWISLWYAALSAELGDDFMEKSHLKDLWVMNLVIPVVFDPHQASEWCDEQLHKYPADTCQAEYRRHFAGTKYIRNDPYATETLHHGFSGVVTYWIAWGGCQAATWGLGWFAICTPVSTVAEIAIEKFVAPKASEAIWRTRNPD